MSSSAQNPLTHIIIAKNQKHCPIRRLFIGILLICIAVIIYINLNKLQAQFSSYKSFPLKNSTLSHSRKSYGPPYLAFVISSKLKRFNSTVINLNTILPQFFNIEHKKPVVHNDSRIDQKSDKQVASLLLSFIDMWDDIGTRAEAELTDNDWIFLFEDDVNIVPFKIIESFYPKMYAKWNQSNPNSSLAGLKRLRILERIVEQGLRMAKDDGILYLGTCGPQYKDNITTIRYSADGLFEFRRGTYFCTHAIAYTKWRARRIWKDFSAYRSLHNEVGSDTIAREWQIHSKTYPISVATNIHWPPNTGHHGFFYQDRGAHPSEIQGWASG